MNTGMTWGALPIGLTNPSKYGVQSTDYLDTTWRPGFWLVPDGQILMQKPENRAALHTFLDNLPNRPFPVKATNPVVRWRVDTALDQYAVLTAAVAANDTYIAVDQPLMMKAGYDIYLPESDQAMKVVAVDAAGSLSWTNGAGTACNVRVSRTRLAGPSITAAVGAMVTIGIPAMGEFGEPKEGVTTIPGDALFNFVQLGGVWVRISKQQMNSMMNGDWGTHMKLIQDNDSRVNQMLQQSILFGRRHTENTTDEGQIFYSDGLIRQVRDNILDAGNFGNTLTFDTISNFWDGLFESDNTSATKLHACGEMQFMDFVGVSRQSGMIEDDINYNAQLGVDQFTVKTGGGRIVTVAKMRYAFEKALSNWGITLDAGNLSLMEYEGFGWRWYNDLDVPMRGITTKTDALVGSLGVAVLDPDTCGLIRGGVNRTVTRNTLGPAEA